MPIAIRARSEVVVMGEMNVSTRVSVAPVDLPNRSSSDAGRRPSATGVANRARASLQSRWSTNAVLHHPSHRRTVRTGTP